MSEHDTQAKPSNVTAKPIRLKLPYPISANRYWRTRVAGKIAVTYVSAEAKSYKSIVAWMATAAGETKVSRKGGNTPALRSLSQETPATSPIGF